MYKLLISSILILGLILIVSQISSAENINNASNILSLQELSTIVGGCSGCVNISCAVEHYVCRTNGKKCGPSTYPMGVYCTCTKDGSPNIELSCHICD